MRVCSIVPVLLVLCLSLRAEHEELTPELTASIVERELGVREFEVVEISVPDGLASDSITVDVQRYGLTERLTLRRVSVRSPSCRLLVDRGNGELEPEPLPPERTFRGALRGEPGTLVAATILDGGIVATVMSDGGEAWSVRPLSLLDDRARPGAHLVFDNTELPTPTCGVSELDPATAAQTSTSDSERVGDGEGAGEDCSITIAEIGFDSDYEFYEDDCESDTDTCVAIIEQGLNITSALYERDVKITYRTTAMVLRTDPETDFYAQWPDASDFGDMLSSFRSEWNDNVNDVDYDLAYLMTGKSRPQYGGLAYVGVVCSSSRYGMGIGGWGYEGIFRHEAGHNWGAGHSCGDERRFIMCGNSISAVSGYNVRVMSRHRDSRSCLFEEAFDPEPSPPFVRLDRKVISRAEGPVVIDVVRGDTDADCDELSLLSFDARSAFGAEIQTIDPIDSDANLALLYRPRSDFIGTDYFAYTVADESGFEVRGTVLVEILPQAMLLHLPFEENDGDETDDISGFGHDGELRDDLLFETASVPGRFGQALQFTGIDGQYVSLGDPSRLSIRREIAVAAWFRIDGLDGSGESIVSKGSDAYRLKRVDGESTLRFTCSGVTVDGDESGNIEGSTDVDDGEWHHVVGVYDGRQISLYIDGELDNALPATGLIGANSSSVRIGDNAWNGAIDEVKIYSHALDADQVATLFQDARIENTDPPDGATGIVPGTPLTWLPAASATAHDVYVGDSLEAVLAANRDSPEYQGRVQSPTSTPDIAVGQTQWWRVDEVAGARVGRGDVRRFTSSFAFTNFDEPSSGASNHTPGAGDRELGFRSRTTPTGGDNPLIGVVDTSSTSSSPVFAHRSFEATTTFDVVDLSERGRAIASLYLQARSTGYETGDFVRAHVTDGTETRSLVRLDDSVALSQRAGTGYATYAASIPANWENAQLVVESSSNSGSASERFDFDRIGFSCHKLFRVLASTRFAEPDLGAEDYAPANGARELGFVTNRLREDGANPLTGVFEHRRTLAARFLSHRSVEARTTFSSVDLSEEQDVRVTVVLRVLDTGYESGDFLRIWATNGDARVDLVDLDGDSGLDGLADDDYRSFSALLPDEWNETVVVVSTASDSSSDAEGFDIALVELTSETVGDPCDDDGPPPPPEEVFRRGDTNDDGRVDLSDGVLVLNFLFLGNGALDCRDAADTDNSGGHDLSDGVTVFNYLFVGGVEPPSPGVANCGPDPDEDDGLDCATYISCEE